MEEFVGPSFNHTSFNHTSFNHTSSSQEGATGRSRDMDRNMNPQQQHTLPNSTGEIIVGDESDEVSDFNAKNNKFLQNLAGIAGNVLEWYDFAVFGYFSDVIGQVFFPPQEGNKAIMESFAVFGLAFLCRPIGGLIMGYIGDTYGRKRALEISMFLMAYPTFLLGCLPSYAQVGDLAIVFLILVRILQGLSVGGQLVTSLVYTCENNPRSQWGLYGSYVMAAANFGTLLGGLMAYFLRANLTEDQLISWGWRLPFMSGILVSFCAIYLKYYCDDDSIEQLHTANGEAPTNPIRSAFAKGNRMILFSSSLIPMLWAGGFYICFVWMATFMDVLVKPPVPDAFGVNAAALLFSVCIFFPFAGALSDKYGRRIPMNIGGLAIAFFCPIMIIAISKGNDVGAFFAQSFLGIALSLYGAPMCAFLVESFPVHMRLTSVAIGYNVAHAIVGGASPALATYLVDKYGNASPGYMVTFIAVFSLLGLFLVPDAAQLEEMADSDATAGIGIEIIEPAVRFESGLRFHSRDFEETRAEPDNSRNSTESVVSYDDEDDDDPSDDGMSFGVSDAGSTDSGLMQEEML